MKGAIIYQGKYGATQQYAQWLADETHLDVFPSSTISRNQLVPYNFLVIGSSVYIGKLQIRKWLKKNLPYLHGKKIFFFQVAGTSPTEIEKRKEYNLSGPREIMDHCECFFLPGKMNIKSLSWADRFMLRVGARLAKDPAVKKEMLTDYDHVSKAQIKEIATAIVTFLKMSPVMQ